MSINREGKGNWIFGLILVIIGTIFIIENFTNIDLGDKIWGFWPIILLVWGIKEIWQNKSVFFGILLIAIGAIFLAKNFNYFTFPNNIGKYWPLLIIALGIDRVFKSFGGISRFRARRMVKEEEKEM
jgi:hypothetical protein